jgi:hypothetical protein
MKNVNKARPTLRIVSASSPLIMEPGNAKRLVIAAAPLKGENPRAPMNKRDGVNPAIPAPIKAIEFLTIIINLFTYVALKIKQPVQPGLDYLATN